jgi:hypothetical protein
MSSTRGVNAENRIPEDFYPTPHWLVWALMQERPDLTSSMTSMDDWLEPCAGDGAIIEAVAQSGEYPLWTAVELRAEALKTLRALGDKLDKELGRQPHETTIEIDCPENFLMWSPAHGRKFAVGITNPPFRYALPIIERTMLFCRQTVMLLPMSFLGSQERLPFHAAHPADIVGPIMPRASFTGDGGTDSQEYGWFIWPGEGRYKVIDAVALRDRWEAEQEQTRRRRPPKPLDLDQLPLFKK